MDAWIRGLAAMALVAAAPAAAQQPATADPGLKPIRTVQEFSQVFSDVAEAALPTVVTILASRDLQEASGSTSTQAPDGAPFQGLSGDPPLEEDPPQEPSGESIQRALGSGVVVREDGIILTNHHVIDKADRIRVRLHDHREIDAKVVGTDPKSDLAVLRVEAQGLQPGKLGDSDAMRIGEWVLCVGSPLSETLEYSVTAGIVSAKGRSNVGLADYEDYIQTDAAINPGNSGGPMLNLRGEIVGINTAIASQTGGYQGVGFAVPSAMARNIMQQLIEHGKVTRGWLGVIIQDLDETLAEAFKLPSREGVLVGDVIENGPAAKAGVEVGDVLLRLDGHPIRDVTEVRNRIAGVHPGSQLHLEILRDGRKSKLTVDIVELVEEEPAPAVEISAMEELGLRLLPVTESLAERYGLPATTRGLVVSGADEGGVAWNAGLREGDLLLSAGEQPLRSVADLQQAVAKVKPGAPVLLFVEREAGTLFIAFRRPG
jgi:serine protease Do